MDRRQMKQTRMEKWKAYREEIKRVSICRYCELKKKELKK